MKKIVLISLIFIFRSLLAQNPGISSNLPTVIPPSPAAQNFMRYGEIPVGYSTGVPDIQIPIYHIKGKKLSLPISISYHASGIKVQDISSEVGLGWVLNAGGIISRSVLDTRDEFRSGVRTYSNAEQFLNAIPNIVFNSFTSGCLAYPGVQTVENYLDTKYQGEDLMSDRYFYRLPNGVNGVFRFNYPQEDTMIMLPYRPYKIEKNSNMSEYTITDDNGTVYKFKRFQDFSNDSTDWYLKEMTSSDGTEKIDFSYSQSQNDYGGVPTSSLMTTRNNIVGFSCDPTTEQNPITRDWLISNLNSSVVLTKIESNDVIVSISYSNREDFANSKKISQIIINFKKSTITDTEEKKIIFNHSYFGNVGYTAGYQNQDKRLKLNSLNIYGKSPSEPETYTFNYETEMLPPYFSKAIDFWGYYNGAVSNGTTVPNTFLKPPYQYTGYGANRLADNGYFAKACMLKEIRYPTGGKSAFEFDRGYVDALFYGPNNGGYIGGLRVSKITNYSADNVISNIKSYKYGNSKHNIIDLEYYFYQQKYIDQVDPNFIYCSNLSACWSLYSRDVINSYPVISHDLTPGLPIAYMSVSEYDGTLADNNGYTEYSYSSPGLYIYNNPLRELHNYQDDDGNYESKLGRKLVVSKTGKTVFEEIYSYSDHFNQEFNTGINITRTMTNLANLKNMDLTSMGCPNCVEGYIQSIKAHNTKAHQKASLLDYSIKKTYDLSNPVRFVKDSIHYTYNQQNLLLKESSTFNSLGQNIIEKYKYPQDYSSSEPYQTMISKNILTPLLEHLITNDNKQISKNQVSYKNWANNIIEPEFVKTQGDIVTPLESRIRYLSYDEKGNIRSLKMESSTPITYLWGYNKSLPIAMVENSDFVSQTESDIQDKTVTNNLYIPMGNTAYELGTFTIADEKNYKIDRVYEKIPNSYSVMYQITFENLTNSANSVSFTDSTPSGGNSHTFTTPSQLLKPGNYKAVLTNIGYNGYQGMIEHQFNFTIYNTVNISKSIPFHTSFEDDIESVNKVHAKTGNQSHIGQYTIKLPSAVSASDKVIVSYWGKASDTSPWEYVENIVNVAGQDYLIGQYHYYIDEVRVYPVDSRMTTFTYDPFYKQQTSVMSPNGQTQYFDYDHSGRLSEIYIMEGNIKKTQKKINLHYKP